MKSILVFFLFIALAINSCEPEPDDSHEYIYKNYVDKSSKIIFFSDGKAHKILNDTFIFINPKSTKSMGKYSEIMKGTIMNADSAFIIFDDTMIVTYNRQSNLDHNILLLEFYETKQEKIGFSVTYTITNEDYLKAVKIK